MAYKLPKRFYKYFWDTDPSGIDMRENKVYVITRIMNHGNKEDLTWLLKRYKLSLLKEILMKYRDFYKETAESWTEALGLERSQIKCLNIPYIWCPTGQSSPQYKKMLKEVIKEWGLLF